MKAFGHWLMDQRSRICARSRLGEKPAYIASHWNGLQSFLSDGRVEIDSNAVENLIPPIALNRKTQCSQVATKTAAHGVASPP